MFILKFKKLISLLKNNKLDDSYVFSMELLKKYPQQPQIYTILAKICFKKNELNQCKKFLLALFSLPDWYKEKIVREILEITNWKMLCSNKYYCKEPKFSPNGEKIVFVCVSRDTNDDGLINNSDCGGIYITDRNGKEIHCIVEDSYYNLSPVFSPNGRYICYFSAREDTNGDGIIDNRDKFGLYIFDLINGEEKLLVDNIYSPKHPSFSSDGQKIVFSCWATPNAKSGIYEIGLKNLTLKTLIKEDYENISPLYSKDNRYLLYSSFRGLDEVLVGSGPGYNSGIYIKDLYNEKEIMVASPKYINTFPIFSNDGKKIAFLSKRRDTNNDGIINSLDNDGIYVFDIETKKEYCVHSDKYYNKFINFTYDDKYLVFLSTSHKDHERFSRDFFEYKGIYMCRINGKDLKQVVSEKFYGCSSPNVSPKRYEVVYTSFRKNTLRGLYLAYLFNLPTKEEILEIIKQNI